jgi:hypothetical protein
LRMSRRNVAQISTKRVDTTERNHYPASRAPYPGDR